MKKLTVMFNILISLLLYSSIASAQCDADRFIEKSMEKLPVGYQFLKSYKIDGEQANIDGRTKTKVEFPYIFSKNSTYMITLANKDTEIKGVVLTLTDANRKMVATNFDPKSKKYFPGVAYTCNSTGVYYLTFSFENTKDYCAAAVLGFKR